MLLVHLFVCFARVYFCPLSLPLGVGSGLRFVIVDTLDLSINCFNFLNHVLQKDRQFRIRLQIRFGPIFSLLHY